MPGRHADPTRSSVKSDLIRFLVLLAVLATVLIGGFALLSRVLSTDDGSAAAATDRTTGTTLDPTTTRVSTTTVPTTTPASTSTTTEGITTTEASTATTGAATTTAAATTTTAAVALDPTEVSVLVLNSTSRTGLAARFVERLDALGYQTPEPSNYPNPLDTSRVWYVEGFELEAGIIAELVPDAIVEVTPLESPRAAITVVLGASFTE